jgi:TetR/AcrR family fatty acid metabolism transcriptional regulator
VEFTARQIEILEVSMKLIAQHGIQHLTTKNIAVAMGFTEPSIYRHFKNKTAILEGIVHHYKAQTKAPMQQILQSKMNSLEQLLEMIEVQFSHFSKNPAISIVIFSDSIFQHEKSLSKTVKSIIDGKVKLTDKMMLTGQEEGVIRKDVAPSELTTMYIGCIRFTLLKWKLSGYAFDLTKESQKLRKTLPVLLS